MNAKLFKSLKIIVPIVSLAVSGLSNYLSGKDLDDKVAKKVAEALAEKAEKGV